MLEIFCEMTFTLYIMTILILDLDMQWKYFMVKDPWFLPRDS